MKWKRPRGKNKITGLGDVVALVAKPIARAIDSVAGTDLEHCSGCAARQKLFNDKFPFLADAPPPAEEESKTVIVSCLDCGRK